MITSRCCSSSAQAANSDNNIFLSSDRPRLVFAGSFVQNLFMNASGMSEVALELRRKKNEILQEWEKRVRGSLPVAREESPRALRDSLPDFLDDLEKALSKGIVAAMDDIDRFAHKHGSERAFDSHYTLEEALIEYNVLRQVLFEMLETNGPLQPPARNIILDAVGIGKAKAGAEYSKLQMRQLRQAYQRLKEATDMQPALIAQVGVDHRYLFVNKTYEDWFNIAREAIIGKTIEEVAGSEVWKIVRPAYEKVFQGEQVTYEAVMPFRNGDKYIHAVYTPGRNEKGEVTSAFISIHDITSIKEKENKLRASETQYRQLADSIPQLAWTADSSGHMDFCNARVIEFTGKPPEEVKSDMGFHLIHPEDVPHIRKLWEKGLRDGSEMESEFRLRKADGTYHWFLLRVVPLKDENGKVIKWFGTNTDITEQKAMLDALHEETVLKDKFVSTLSHDLRTPLTAARISAELIRRKFHDDPAPALSTRIIDNLDRANKMIEDLLDASKVRAGEEIIPDISETDIVDVTKRTLEDLSTIHGDRFVLSSPAQLEAFVDRNGFRRILENLCSNAIKYGAPNTPVTINLKLDDGHLTMSVHNKGNPSMKIDKDKLFEPFHRGEGAATKKGWGIGLTIVKGITEAHRGEVTVETSPEGTTFTIRIPTDVRRARGKIQPNH
ncbi:MAG: PAS domain S-box protein [Bacteriovoracaceae bacterium]